MTDLAVAAHPLRPKLKTFGNPKMVTVGFEFEFICPERTWDKLPGLVTQYLGDIGEVSRQYATHSSRRDRLTSWHITGDSSITDYNLGEDRHGYVEPKEDDESDEDYNERYDEAKGEVAVELISPVLSAAKIGETLSNVAKVLYEVEARTNSSCGLHITLGNDKIKANFDPIKFALFLGDEKILKHFDREDNEYAKSLLATVDANLDDTQEFFDNAVTDDNNPYRNNESNEDDWDEDEDNWDTDSSIQEQVFTTPYEVMRNELTKKRAPQARMPLDRQLLLSHLAKMDSGYNDDRYSSVNLQKVASNLIEYRAPGNYLPVTSRTSVANNMAKIAGIARRAVGALLVSVGAVESPEIDKQYATMLHLRFDPNRRKTELPFKGKKVIPSIHNNYMVHLRNDCYITVMYSITPHSDMDTVALSLTASLHSGDKTLMDVGAELYLSCTREHTAKITPQAPSIFYRNFGDLSATQVATIVRGYRRVLDNPLNPALAPIWKGLSSALIAVSRASGANEPLVTLVGRVREVRDAKLLPALKKQIPEVTAQLMSSHMSVGTLFNRQGREGSLAQKAVAGAEKAAFQAALNAARIQPITVMQQGVLGIIFRMKVKSPLDTQGIVDYLERELTTAPPGKLFLPFRAVVATGKLGVFRSVGPYTDYLVAELSGDNVARWYTAAGSPSIARIVVAAATLVAGAHPDTAGQFTISDLSTAADVFASRCGKSSTEFRLALASDITRCRELRTYATDYDFLWAKVLPRVYKTIGSPDINIGYDLHRYEATFKYIINFAKTDYISTAWHKFETFMREGSYKWQ